MNFPHIAARLFDTPLLIDPGKLATIVAVLGPRIDASRDWGLIDPAHANRIERSDSGYRVADGVAIIPVEGSLVHRGSTPDAISGLTGYNRLSEWFRAALDDQSVHSILLDIDSPGGEVAGAFDFSDEIFAARGQKPIVAIAADLAASAGYAIASAADEVVVTRTGRVGSVGVALVHADYSRAVEKQGVNITLIHAGAHKVDGNSYAPLPDEVRQRVQTEVDRIHQIFIATVARNRGIDEAAVRATEALTYMGEAAIEIGFADRIATRESAFAALVQKHKAQFFSHRMESLSMKDDLKQPTATSDQPQPDTAAIAAASEARTAERQRIRDILQSEASACRQQMAAHLAFETDMAADAAVSLLATAPQTALPPNPVGPLAAAMSRLEAPNVGNDAPEKGAPSKASAILSDFHKATGRP
ncbi:MAG: S49 family peptidase [Betaproteobacteria bacterium]|nr:S49 family peptidase [Betaproteobacteria bacterium]